MKYILIILSLLYSQITLSNENISDEIRKVVDANLLYMETENVDGVMSTVHTQSLSYLPTKDALSQIFGNYKLEYVIEDYSFIGHDGELAYVRVKQATNKVSGLTFQNNRLDMLQVFKKENGVWKLWAQANLEVEYIQ